jgi:dTDP-4-dehydrorhamnose 3,5-epimerase
MTVIPTPLDGAFVIELDPRRDERGFFVRTYCREEFTNQGLATNFIQSSQSRTLGKGSIRGMHFQQPPHLEVKLVRCLRGAMLDVFVDLRKGSPSFLQWFAVELSETNFRMAYLPAGLAHGFQTLTDEVDVLYDIAPAYVPGAEGRVRFDDPLLGIRWPLPICNVSAKDAVALPLPSDFSGLVSPS